MSRNLVIAFRTVRRVAMPLTLLVASTVLADGTAAGDPAKTTELKTTPAVQSPVADKAMMLGSARAGKRIVAVGDHGIVLLSDDNGKTFRQAKTVPVRVTLTSVFFANETTGWAVGHWGVILATSDGGDTWQVQRSDTTVDQPLFSVHFKDASNGLAVGLWSLMLTTNDGGKTWNRTKLPPPPGGGRGDRNLLSIIASSRGTLLVAAEQGTVLRSTDDGANWSYVQTGYKGSFWAGVALKNGALLVGGLRGTVYKSIDDGKTWIEINSGVKSSLTDFSEINGKVYGVGLDGVYIESSDSGSTFKASQRESRTPFTSLVVTEQGTALAFSKGGIVRNFPEEKISRSAN